MKTFQMVIFIVGVVLIVPFILIWRRFMKIISQTKYAFSGWNYVPMIDFRKTQIYLDEGSA